MGELAGGGGEAVSGEAAGGGGEAIPAGEIRPRERRLRTAGARDEVGGQRRSCGAAADVVAWTGSPRQRRSG
jgi:hypothetical protein